MKLTIFTPTYNRAYILLNLYESLLKQNYTDFEWIIVDDASSDNTEELVSSWIESAPFKILYHKQEHGGKHRAMNKAFTLAKGEFFFTVDSDDYLADDALETIYPWLDDIYNSPEICGVSGLRGNEKGVIGGIPNIEENKCVIASNFERKKYGLLGDKAEIYRTEILRQFPFPEFDNEYFVTEAVCWNAIANAGYKIKWYNKVIYNCEYLEGGLSKSGANDIEGHVKNYKGYAYYIANEIKYHGLTSNPRLLREYHRTVQHLKKTNSEMAHDLGISVTNARLFGIYIYIGFIKRGITKIFKGY